MAAGQRPINNVVDITNYVMLLTGQPMHAFDADLVAGGTARRAPRARRRDDDDARRRRAHARRRRSCVIDDAEGPTSIAGVMGGARSEVRGTTTRVLMEAATWNGPNIQRTSTRLGLRTEASGRFEKQLQPEQALEGQAVADAADDRAVRRAPGRRDDRRRRPRARSRATLRLRDARTERLLGAPVPRADAARILDRARLRRRASADDGLDVTRAALAARRRRRARPT